MLIETMTQLDKSSRYAVYAACLIISGVAMYGYIVSSHVKYLKAVENFEPAVDKIIEKQVDLSRALVDRKKTLEDLKVQFDAIGFTIFNAEQRKQFLAGLETLAEEFTCSIAKMDSSENTGKIVVGEASDSSYVESVETSLTVLGEYSQLILFIDAIQHQERQIWLKAVDIDLLKDQERVLKCDITIQLYVLQEVKQEAGL